MSVREQLLSLVDEGFDRKAWHGTTLLGGLRGLKPDEAEWRPAVGRHNIWELTVHAAYWKYAVRRRLTGQKRGTFAIPGTNWFSRPTSGASWADDVRLLIDEHKKLRAVIAEIPERAIARDAHYPGKSYGPGFLIRGIAAHDLYHAGQIQLIKRLYAQRGAPRRARARGLS